MELDMTVLISTLTIKGQTTVPEAVRNALPIKPGQRLSWEIHDGFLTVRPVRDLAELAGCLKSDNPPVSTEDIRKAAGQGRARQMARKYGKA